MTSFRDDLRESFKESPGRAPSKGVRGWRAEIQRRLGHSGERPPYTALVIGTAMLGVYAFSHAPVPEQTAEILREGPSPKAAWTQPATADLLAGTACIPIERLLENRLTPTSGAHSYSRDVMCPKQVASR